MRPIDYLSPKDRASFAVELQEKPEVYDMTDEFERQLRGLKIYGWSHMACGNVAGLFPSRMTLDEVTQYLDDRLQERQAKPPYETDEFHHHMHSESFPELHSCGSGHCHTAAMRLMSYVRSEELKDSATQETLTITSAEEAHELGWKIRMIEEDRKRERSLALELATREKAKELRKRYGRTLASVPHEPGDPDSGFQLELVCGRLSHRNHAGCEMGRGAEGMDRFVARLTALPHPDPSTLRRTLEIVSQFPPELTKAQREVLRERLPVEELEF